MIKTQQISYHELCKLASEMGFDLLPALETGKYIQVQPGKIKIRERKQFVKTYVKVVEKLNEGQVLSDAECVFLFKIIPFCDINTNILVNRRTKIPLNIRSIAEILNRQERQARTIVKGLVDKNILAKIESGFCFKYCLNPEIHWNGGDIKQKRLYEQMFYTNRDVKLKEANKEFKRFKKVYVNGRACSVVQEV